LRVVGRCDDQIKIAGHRLTTGEMESAICKTIGVAECAVIGVADEIKGEIPLIFIVPKTETAPADLKEKVIETIRNEIGPIALPKDVIIIKDLPKTRSGKIMRRLLRKAINGENMDDLSTLSNPESIENIKGIIESQS